MTLQRLREAAAKAPDPGPVLAELRGHSGARVTLHGASPDAFVRKTAGHAGQNVRLQQQAEKQARFHGEGAPVPRVLRTGLAGGLFFFDMTHLSSVSIAARCQSGATAAGLMALSRLVSAWIDRMRATVAGTLEAGRVSAKIDGILTQCRNNAVLHDAMPVITLLGVVLRQVDWCGLPQSDCHGDLTLENILAGSDGSLSLIDFDVPDLPSLWFDIAKLYQDLDGFWCLRELAREGCDHVGYLNAVLALRRLRTAMDDVVHLRLPELASRLPALVALNLLRTLPYCTDRGTAFYVIDRARCVLAGRAPGAG